MKTRTFLNDCRHLGGSVYNHHSQDIVCYVVVRSFLNIKGFYPQNSLTHEHKPVNFHLYSQQNSCLLHVTEESVERRRWKERGREAERKSQRTTACCSPQSFIYCLGCYVVRIVNGRPWLIRCGCWVGGTQHQTKHKHTSQSNVWPSSSDFLRWNDRTWALSFLLLTLIVSKWGLTLVTFSHVKKSKREYVSLPGAVVESLIGGLQTLDVNQKWE